MPPPDTLRFLSGAPPHCPSTVPSVRDASESGIRLAVGTVIGGAYRVIDHLGSGSMGTVVLAYDDTLDRQVAIKFVNDNLNDSGFRERFMREARAMARVNHPNVLQIHTFGEQGGAPYFVMEYVDGQTLEGWLSKLGKPPPLDVALEILDGVCAGVDAIHSADALHRDIKPSNILLDSELRPRVADLGLAVLSRDDMPKKAELVGTPAYMAPEIVFGDVDPAMRERVDVYSLACVAYELFTGKPPFASETNLGLLLQHATDAVPPMNATRDDLPAELCEAVLRGLAKNPQERTPTAEAFRRDLIAGCRGTREPVRILVAEDNDDFREALKFVLEAEFVGADIECVADGEAAFAAFDRKRPSVVILDLRMPGKDGMELTGLFRQRDPKATIPILVLTASGGAEEWRQLAAQGADRLLVKPVVLDDVVALVRRSLSEKAKKGPAVAAA
ncbi:MAG TPA: protein kinase [Polyangiaceae bacterium]|jgi:serine/threonine protein kinase|nr:protein kinase [Polyangiaceae bacterium]